LNFIDYTGDLEITVYYGGKQLVGAKKSNVKGDHLIHSVDILNMEIIKGLEKIMQDIKNGVIKK
jgi:23S rRNA U2552 (ribose-2'-O)-methylase RlmE/FtsJ